MHIISQQRVWEAKKQFPNSASALDGWYRVLKKNYFENFAALKTTFKSVDKVGDLYVFNVGGNKLRVIAGIHFGRSRVYIRFILTHKEYDKGKWKTTIVPS